MIDHLLGRGCVLASLAFPSSPFVFFCGDRIPLSKPMDTDTAVLHTELFYTQRVLSAYDAFNNNRPKVQE